MVRRMTRSRGKERAALAILLLLGFGIAACARMETRPAAVPPPPGVLQGVLTLDNTLTVSLSGAQIRVEDQAVTVGEGGAFSLPGVSPGKQFLVAEKRFPSGTVRRLLGVSTVYVSDSPIEVRIRMRDATEVDRFCSDCHPMLREVTRRDQIARDVHPSGIVPKKANKPSGKLDDKGRVTCESCHSVHLPTGFPHFTLASYQDGKLCVRCH